MPNGKPGDHPLTDIVVHGLAVFGEPSDGLIKEILQLGGKSELERRFDLTQLDPTITHSHLPQDGTDLAALERGLVELRDQLRAVRKAHGWEAD